MTLTLLLSWYAAIQEIANTPKGDRPRDAMATVMATVDGYGGWLRSGTNYNTILDNT